MGFHATSSGKRVGCFAMGGMLLLFLFTFILPGSQAVQAQEDAAKADASAEAPGEPAPNLFMHMVKSAGPIFGPLLLLVSIALVSLIVLLAMDLRMVLNLPPEFVEQFSDTVNKRKFKEAFELAKGEPSFLGRVLAASMARLQYGIEDARDAALNSVDSIKATKEQLITYLATIGTLGPMLGLVGTVYGMILSFMELAKPGASPKPSELAKGISHALVVTLLGIGLSVPAIFCHAFFRNRLIRITMDVSNLADDLLTQMYHNSRKPAPSGAGETKAPSGAASTATMNATPAVASKPAQ